MSAQRQPSTLDLLPIAASMPLAGPGSHVRIGKGEFFADIFPDPRAGVKGYHFIVQRENSTDLLHWGREKSRQAALEAASALMKFLAKKRAVASAG